MISILDEDTQDDPIEELQEKPMIENIVEDSPHVTIAENIEDLRYSQVCCNADIFPEIPLEEPTKQHILSDPIGYVQKVSLIEDSIEDPFHDIITEAYKKTYDKISMVCDDTRPCSPYTDDSLEGLLPYDLFSKDDQYGNEDKYNLEHGTSDRDSLISDKYIDEESWTFMENPVYDMNKEENNKPEIFDGFVDFSIYAYLKERAWTMWPWETLI